MASDMAGVTTMGKKKAGAGAGPPTTAIKVERAIVTRAKMIATDKGIDLSAYVSMALRGAVEKDWHAMVRRAAEGGEKS